ncbi:hypothetical protein D3C78_1676380 [compost metagenome]
MLAAFAVGQPTEDPATDWPHQEARSEYPGRVQQLHRGVIGGEEGWRKIDCAEGVDVEVEPLHQVA